MDVRLLVSGVVLATVMVAGSRAQMDVCGTAPLSSKIVGGKDASAGEWPWQVSLQVGSVHICGGTLISDQWVLTAAQCVQGLSASLIQVSLGRLSLKTPSPNEILKKVGRVVTHPLYIETMLLNDITLLQLDSPVKFTDYIRPVCLAAGGSDFMPGTECSITGWGNIKTNVELPPPQTLQKANVQVISNEDCKDVYVNNGISNSHICTRPLSVEGMCMGDSGGPLLRKHGDRWLQVGVMSFISANGCGIPSVPEGYTRVSSYQSWIESYTGSPGFVYAGTSRLVSFSLPLLFAVSLFVLSLSQL